MWNYRIIKDADTYGLYEVFYNDEDEICAHSEKAEIYGDDVEDIVKTLELMLGDAKKCQKKDSVLEKDKIEFKKFWDGDKEELITYEIDDLDKLLDE
jgi:hypothetical protein